MLHYTTVAIFPECYGTSKIALELADCIANQTHDGCVCLDITQPSTQIFSSYDIAMEYLNAIYNNSLYDGVAIKFYDYRHVEQSEREIELRHRLEKLSKERDQYVLAHSVHSLKAAYVGCPNCGSKLKKTLLRTNQCPLCDTDLRPASMLEKVAYYKAKIAEYNQLIKQEREKNILNGRIVKWLVKYGYDVDE